MITKPEDTPISNPLAGQEIPKFEGGGLASQQVTSLNDFRKDVGKRSLNPNVDERPVAPDKPSQLTPSMLRDCALPEYNGDSDEYILGGKVTAVEALQLYRDHFAKIAKEQGLVNAQEVDEVSPAEIFGAGGRKLIWLPVLYSRGQMLQIQKGTIAKQAAEIKKLEGEAIGLKATIRRQNETIDAKNTEIISLKDRIVQRETEINLLLAIQPKETRPWWKFWG